jgi:D-alanyl-D-alanine carboxypeptidase/D-alanyl-D-alanine-endopeptidase (penicillin-binding protein 4)
MYAASIVRMQLEAQGIRVSAGTLLGALPDGARELLRFEGEPLALVIRNLNKYSNNFIAEQLTKGLGAECEGAPGNWEKGTSSIRAHLESLDLIDPGTVIADGSGLSPRNRVSARMLVGVLRNAVKRSAWAPEFLASLPLSGRDGTLEERFVSAVTLIRGKTGHLRSVASLVGIVAPTDGRSLAFAIIVNGASSNPADVDRAIDSFVSALRDNP